MAQFLSRDPHIKAPGNWYNYNRYGYYFNNPLIYNDPSGEFIGALFAVWGTNYLINSVAYAVNNKVSLKSAFKATPFVGGVGFSPTGFISGQQNMGFSHPQLDAHLAVKNEMRISGELDAFIYAQGGKGIPMGEGVGSNDGLAMSVVGQVGFGLSKSMAKGAISVLEKEHIRQVVINETLVHPKFRSDDIPYASLKLPKWIRFAGKYGGYGFSVWGAADIRSQYKTGQISEMEMWREQGSNAVGALPIVGTAWTVGWEAGRGICTTSVYQEFKYSFWRNYYELRIGGSIESDPVFWNNFHCNYKP